MAKSRGPKLNGSQREKLKTWFKKTVGQVDRTDVKYALDKGLEKVQETLHSSVDWIADLGRQASLLLAMLKEWWAGRYDVPWGTVAAITAALLYFINPLDLIPDFIPVAGLIDDALVITICYKMVQSDLRKYARARKLDLKAHGL